MNTPDADALVAATEAAICAVDATRFFATERGFHGRFYCALQSELERAGLLTGGLLLEMEYQKSARHHTWQRPDIVLHVPVEESGASPTANNVAAWALKRRATTAKAKDDFRLLDDLIDTLFYPLGFFINVDSDDPMLQHYEGSNRRNLRAVAAWQRGGKVLTRWSSSEA